MVLTLGIILPQPHLMLSSCVHGEVPQRSIPKVWNCELHATRIVSALKDTEGHLTRMSHVILADSWI